MEQLLFVNQNKPQAPKQFQQGMNYPSPFSTNYNSHFQPWCPPNTSHNSFPTAWPNIPQIVIPPSHPYPHQPPQCGKSSSRWRPHASQAPASTPPPHNTTITQK